MHWLDGVARILESNSKDLRHLASIAGVDPTTIYRYADLSKCDLRGQDLRGLDLTGAMIEGAYLDSQTLMDPEFDPRSRGKVYKRITISRNVISIINSQAMHSGYTYAIWYAKYILDTCSRLVDMPHFRSFCLEFHKNGLASDIYTSDSVNRNYVRHVQMYSWSYDKILGSFSYIDEHDAMSFACISTIIFSEFNRSIDRRVEDSIERIRSRRPDNRYMSDF
jgi:hypothetical protein